MKFSLASLLTLAPLLARAILVTSPTNTSTFTTGDSATLWWTSVDTDPTTFGVVLVNFVYWPPSYIQLATSVCTADNSTTVTIPCDTAAMDGYQFNLINGTNLYVIYAQSAEFSITACDDCDDGGDTPEPSCAASTITVTAMPIASSGKLSETYSYGNVPKTIGWDKAGYGSPVTLSSVPAAGPTKGWGHAGGPKHYRRGA